MSAKLAERADEVAALITLGIFLLALAVILGYLVRAFREEDA